MKTIYYKIERETSGLCSIYIKNGANFSREYTGQDMETHMALGMLRAGVEKMGGDLVSLSPDWQWEERSYPAGTWGSLLLQMEKWERNKDLRPRLNMDLTYKHEGEFFKATDVSVTDEAFDDALDHDHPYISL